MKIGILTQPLHNNYGGILQAYALTKILKNLGHDAIVINRIHEEQTIIRLFASFCKRIILKYLFGKKNNTLFQFHPTKDQNKLISIHTSRFISKYIPITEKLSNTNKLSNLINKGYNVFIVGSDQVWRPAYSPKITNYFLDFTEDKPVKRISYAASFGVDQWEYSIKQTQECSDLIKKFNAISVREDSGIELCKKYLGVDASHLLDPTMLLSACDYKELVEIENESKSPGNLMTYILDTSTEKKKFIENVSKQLGLIPFSTLPKNKLTKSTRTQIEDCIFPPVTSWIRGFQDAEFVITDSFHGCVFSILFNKPFVVIGNSNRGMSRFDSLLKLFHLEDKLIFENNLNKFPNKKINWNEVNDILTLNRESSKQFLIDNLS